MKDYPDLTPISREISSTEAIEIFTSIGDNMSMTWTELSNKSSDKTCFSTSRCANEKYKFSWNDGKMNICEYFSLAIAKLYMFKLHARIVRRAFER